MSDNLLEFSYEMLHRSINVIEEALIEVYGGNVHYSIKYGARIVDYTK